MLRGRAGGHLRAELGRQVTMGCEYRLTSEELYSIKWYRDHNEFYRFLPTGESTPISISTWQMRIMSIKDRYGGQMFIQQTMQRRRLLSSFLSFE